MTLASSLVRASPSQSSGLGRALWRNANTKPLTSQPNFDLFHRRLHCYHLFLIYIPSGYCETILRIVGSNAANLICIVAGRSSHCTYSELKHVQLFWSSMPAYSFQTDSKQEAQRSFKAETDSNHVRCASIFEVLGSLY